MDLKKIYGENSRSIEETLKTQETKNEEEIKKIKEKLPELLKHPYIEKICKEKGIKVDELFKTNFDSLCDQLYDIWEVGINPNDIIAECLVKGKTDLKIYFNSKVNLVYRCIMTVQKKINAQSLDEVIVSEELLKLLTELGIDAKELEEAINRMLEKIEHHRTNNMYMYKIFNEFEVIEKMSKESIYFYSVKEEIEKKGLQNEKFKFYEDAKKLDELSILVERYKRLVEQNKKIQSYLGYMHDDFTEQLDFSEKQRRTK